MSARCPRNPKMSMTSDRPSPVWGFVLCALSLWTGPSLAQESLPEPIDPLAGLYRVEPDQTAEITAHGLCKQVTNRNAAPILVPTRRPEEWAIGTAAFLVLPPVGVEVAPCVTQVIDQILTSFTVSPFVDLSGQKTNTITYSNEAEMRGDAAPLAFTVTGGPDAAASINDGAWVTSGTIGPGDRIRLRARTSASFNTPVSTRLQIEDYAGTWQATTGDVSQSCVMTSVNASTNGWGTWWGDTLSVLWSGSLPGRTSITNVDTNCGLTGPVPIEVLGYEESTLSGTVTTPGGYPQIRINGGPAVTEAMYTPGDSLEILYTTPVGHALSYVTLRLNGYGTATYGQGTVSAKPALSLPTSFNYGSKAAGWSASMVSNSYKLSGSTSSSTWYPSTMAVVSSPWTWSPTISMTAWSVSPSSTPASIKLVKNGVDQASLPVTFASGDTIALKLKSPSSGSGTMRYRMLSTSGSPLGASSDYFIASFDGTLSTGNFSPAGAARSTVVTSNSLWAAPLASCGTASLNVPTSFSTFDTSIIVNGVSKGRTLVTICNGDEVQLKTKTPTFNSGTGNFTLTMTNWTKTWSVTYN